MEKEWKRIGAGIGKEEETKSSKLLPHQIQIGQFRNTRRKHSFDQHLQEYLIYQMFYRHCLIDYDLDKNEENCYHTI